MSEQANSEPVGILHELTADDDGAIFIPVRGLPSGSLITITIRVGPEPEPAPATPDPQKPRHMGSRPE